MDLATQEGMVLCLSHQLTAFQMNAMGDSIKSSTNIQVDNIYSLSFIHHAGYLIINGDEVGQAGPVCHTPMLAGQDSLVLLYMPCVR